MQEGGLLNVQLEVVVQVALDGSEHDVLDCHQLFGVLEQLPSESRLDFPLRRTGGQSRPVCGSGFRVPALLTQSLRLAEFSAIGVAKGECIANSLCKHLVRGGDLNTFQLFPVMDQVLVVPVPGVPLDDVYEAPAEGLPTPVVRVRRAHEFHGHPVCLVDYALLTLGEYLLACNHPCIPSVSRWPTAPTKGPGEQAVSTGWHLVNWSLPL